MGDCLEEGTPLVGPIRVELEGAVLGWGKLVPGTVVAVGTGPPPM